MAVANYSNMYEITTDNDTITVTGTTCICSITYVPGTGSPDATMKETNTSGKVIWNAGAASTRFQDSGLDILVQAGTVLWFDLAGTGTKVYVYTEC